MKKSILLVVAILFGIFSINAQTVNFGAKAGVNFADITGDESDSFDGRTSFHFGAVAEIPVSEKFYFQPEIIYSEQGSDYKDSETDTDGEYTFTETAEGEIRLGYINIPVMAKYYVTEGLSIEAGPQVGFLISAKNEYDYTYTETSLEGDFTDTESGEDDIKDYVKGIDFGVNFGVGYKLESGLNFVARYNLGLTDANDDTNYLGDSTYKNCVIQLSIGYFF
jgi:hypothetical protein